MEKDKLSAKIDFFKNRLDQLQQKVDDPSSLPLISDSENVNDDIRALFEELNVTLEELRVQNEELQSSRFAIEQERERYKELFEFAPDGYLETDVYGVIHEANQAASQMLNVTSKHLVGKPIAVFIDHSDITRFRSFLMKLKLDRNSYPLKEEFTLQPRDGEKFPASLTLAPSMLLAPVGDQNISYRWLIRDVTVLHEIMERLQAQNEILEQRVGERTEDLVRKNKELQEFAFIASHDMQEPMRKVKSFSELLIKRYSSILPEEALDYIDRMMRANERMDDMLDGLLNYTRVTTRAEEFLSTDLNIVLEGVLFDLELLIQQHKGRVEARPLPVIDADANQIRQLFQNLITNALKFHQTDVAPTLEVWAEEDGSGYTRLIFKDNGIGIEPENLEEIYKPFRRLNSPAAFRGSGMGLSICQKIIERHHGKIMASSELGKGSTFTVTLPVKQQAADIE